jgi:hypothetical protein
MKYFVMSDIHGDYPAMMKGIKESGYDKKNPDHQIIAIGDYFGRASRGKGPYGVWKYLTSKTHVNKPICLKGNHEEYFVAAMLKRGYVNHLDCSNGEDQTIWSFFKNIPHINDDPTIMDPVYDYLKDHPTPDDFEDRWSGKLMEEEVTAVNMLGAGKQLREWCDSLPYYYETDHYIFTHGWLPYQLKMYGTPESESLEALTKVGEMKYTYKDYDLHADRQWHHWVWVKTPEEYDVHKAFFPNGWDKWIVIGHWSAFAFGPKADLYTGWNWNPDKLQPEDYNYVVDEQHKVIFCDHCTVLGHKINVLVLED